MVTMDRIKVLLADLRHCRDGVLFADTMPLGIGYMKAVIDRDLSAAVDCEIFAYTDDFMDAINQCSPNIVMVTNYMWNEALSLWYLKEVKRRYPNTLTVMGGPNISIEEERQKAFVQSHPEIDIYALGEGDYLAKDIVQLYLNANGDLNALKQSEELYSCVYNLGGDAYIKNVAKRSRNLDDIPSPWLTGIMDKFFDNKLSPLYETNRGCPFACTFCVQGTKFYTKVTYFGIERVREELFYIAQKIQTLSPDVKILRIADPNFGMYERDVVIAKFMGETQKLYEYPMFIDATTGKNKPERIIKAMEQVSGALIMWQSVQSLDDTVLTNIKRENIKLSTYSDINVYLKGRGLKSQADLILCLPGETLESHLKAMEGLANSGVLRFNNFQAMVLKGSEMETIEYREKFGFATRYRLIQKNFSVHNDDIVFETEEIIISTDSFSFEDYLIARKYHLIINIFLNELRFEKLLNFLDSIQVPRWGWIHEMFRIAEQHEFISDIMHQFEKDTQEELFENEDDLKAFYAQDEIYSLLEAGAIGDNVVHKYRVICNYFHWDKICEFAYAAALRLVLKCRSDIYTQQGFEAFWNDLKKYQYHSSAHGRSKSEVLQETSDIFQYDIRRWISDGMPPEIESYSMPEPLKYRFTLPAIYYRNLDASLNRWKTFTLVSLSLMVRKINQHWLEKEAKEVVSTFV
jgi:radical SAM superfamily enzyme YgiQ (UPF0313 family)